MMKSTMAGAYAAVLTPRQDDGHLDRASFQRQIAFLASHRLAGFAINGATGEFPLTDADELRLLLDDAREYAPNKTIVCGIGGLTVDVSKDFARVAAEHGADVFLLPMPHFFPYRQDDLIAFVSGVLERVDRPVLLYNLPQFTTNLETDTVIELLEKIPGLIGIKDSSGSLETLRAMTAHGNRSVRIVGNDAALPPALVEGVCDAVISGVACVLPELIVALFGQSPHGPEFERWAALLSQYIASIDGLPTPWGLKVTSDARGLAGGAFPMPLSAQRQREVHELRESFLAWLPTLEGLRPPAEAGGLR
jgi:4-hydroxy-tetrahydrodipicolinate synthase